MAKLQTEQPKNGLGKKIIVGATGVALAAGAVAAGVALTDKKNRNKLRIGARVAAKRIRRLKDVIDEGRERVQAISHRIKVAPASRKALRRGRKLLKRVKA